ncbi:MAG: HlyD family efflux transporter periplasmic adaptor subunit [Cyclobacteriaceae bacterium]|nr:HlyD family efflux transporter periplasmic adaptor subunit [Cyclobacteriaceae bacterium]
MKTTNNFPVGDTQFITHYTRVKSRPKFQVIYLIVVFSFILAVFLTPFVKATVSIKSFAVIRPSSEVSSVRSNLGGQVIKLYVGENQYVHNGDSICSIVSTELREREQEILTRKMDAESCKRDLLTLIHGQEKNLKTLLYRQYWQLFKQKINELTIKLKKSEVDFMRAQKLHAEKVIADSDFENSKFAYDNVKTELDLEQQNQLSKWHLELNKFESDIRELKSQLSQIKAEKAKLLIKAQISGNIQNLLALYPGSTVLAGQEIGEISPDTTLIVEAYVTPDDIGLIENNMKGKFQIDAFNYNNWGFVLGRIIDISKDIVILQGKPVFKVRCSLEQEYLQLKNGYKGYLKKGMSLQARFIVAERTLWQLMYDKVDDWVNPDTFRETENGTSSHFPSP